MHGGPPSDYRITGFLVLYRQNMPSFFDTSIQVIFALVLSTLCILYGIRKLFQQCHHIHYHLSQLALDIEGIRLELRDFNSTLHTDLLDIIARITDFHKASVQHLILHTKLQSSIEGILTAINAKSSTSTPDQTKEFTTATSITSKSHPSTIRLIPPLETVHGQLSADLLSLDDTGPLNPHPTPNTSDTEPALVRDDTSHQCTDTNSVSSTFSQITHQSTNTFTCTTPDPSDKEGSYSAPEPNTHYSDLLNKSFQGQHFRNPHLSKALAYQHYQSLHHPNIQPDSSESSIDITFSPRRLASSNPDIIAGIPIADNSRPWDSLPRKRKTRSLEARSRRYARSQIRLRQKIMDGRIQPLT